MDAVEDRLGARPAPGGRHPAYGTRNALLSLGTACYLEVIAPDPELPTPDRGIGFGVEGLREPRLLTWAIRHPAIETAARRAALGPLEAGRRERSDGTTVRWRLTDPYAERMGGVVPFLIDWGDTEHPASTAPSAGRLVGLRLAHPEPERARSRLAELGLEIDVDRATAPRLVAEIRIGNRTVELT